MDENKGEVSWFPITIVENDGTEKTLSDEESREFFRKLVDTSNYLTERDGREAWQAAIRELNSKVPGLVLEQMGGYTPIQGSGTYEGDECYFRARGQIASFSVGTYDEDGNVTSWMAKRKAVAQVVPDDAPYAAGYLTPAECVVIIRDILIPNLQARTKEEGEQELQAYSDMIDSMADNMRNNQQD